MLHSRILGDPAGRPVLFLHPGNATGAGWADLVAELPGIAAICPDLPGFGRSAHHPLRDFADSADLIANLLRAQGVADRVPVVGYSLGGYTGLRLAERHPDLISGALLTSFQAMPVGGRWWLGPLMTAISPLMTRRFARIRGFRALGLPDGGSWAPGPVSPCDAATLRRIAQLAFEFDARDDLAGIKTPLLVLSGDREMQSIRDTVGLVAREVPNARGAFAPGGHGWPVVRSDLFAATVRAWLAGAALPEELVPA
ncbi:MAG: alpha/beta hydrolase [Jannaschia sp.]